MKPPLIMPSNNLSAPTLSPHSLNFSTSISPTSSNLFLNPRTVSCSKHPHFLIPCSLSTGNSIRTHINSNPVNVEASSSAQQDDQTNQLQFVQIKNPNLPPFVSSLRSKFSSTDHAFFLLTFIACTTSASFVSFVAAAVPTLYAMGRAADSLAKLADTAREELPGTMAAVRLSGMEISDLTLELTDLSQEISDGVNKSAQAIVAADVGIRQIGARAREHTISMIQERADLPVISLRPAVSAAAKKTSRAVGHATRTFMNLISRGESDS